MCEVVIQELSPLHEEERVVLRRGVPLGRELRADEARAGQLPPRGGHAGGIHTCNTRSLSRCEADHSSLANPECPYIFKAYCLIKCRENFTLYDDDDHYVKFTLRIIKHHIIKLYGSGGIAPRILNVDISCS